MSLVHQTIENILNGVSQQPMPLRHPSYASEQLNGLSSPGVGLVKRPPTQHVAKLNADVTGAEAFEHEIVRSATEKYRLVIKNGVIAVYDQNGAAATLTTPDGTGYLAGIKGYRAVTVGDTTYLVNRGITVKRAAEVAPSPKYEALVWVRQTDYSTAYTIILDGVRLSYTTPAGTDAASRAQVTTESIAAALFAKITNSLVYNWTLKGSMIVVSRKDGKDFTIETHDGLADRALRAVKGRVQSFEDLPLQATEGFIVEVAGDETNQFDNYWMEYTEKGTAAGQGIWRECAKPGTGVALDPSTMPHAVVYGGLYLPDATVDAVPQAPFVLGSSTAAATVAAQYNESGVDLGLSALDQDMTAHNEARYGTLGAAVTGTVSRRLGANFDIDTSAVVSGTRVKVVLHYRPTSGGVWAEIASREYLAGQTLPNQNLESAASYSVSATAQLRLLVSYGVGKTPTTYRRAVVTIHSPTNAGGAGLYVAPNDRTWVTAEPTRLWPKGTVITFTGSGSTFTYTVAADSATWATVGADLAAQMVAAGWAGTTFDTSSSIAYILLVTAPSGEAPTSPAMSVSFNTATSAFLPNYAMTPGEHVGRKVLNVTDGSEGTITSNGAMSFVVGALTGGARNTFAKDDVIRIVSGATAFTFGPVEWSKRAAGDITTCGFPSFVDRMVSEVFYHGGRLGFLAHTNVVLSQAGEPTSFFRQSAKQLYADDVIDVASTHPVQSPFHAAVEFDEDVFLASGRALYRLSGDPVLTPTTVRLDFMGAYESSADVRPLVFGNQLILCRNLSGFTQVLGYSYRDDGKLYGSDLTKLVPRYLAGAPKALTGDAALGLLVVATTGDLSSIYVYSFGTNGDGSASHAGWSRWTLPGAGVNAVSMSTGILSLVLNRTGADAGTFIEKIDVGTRPADGASYRDRTGYGTTEAYTFTYEPSTVAIRDDAGRQQLNGRTSVQYYDIHYVDTRSLTVTVKITGRADRTYSLSLPAAASGVLRVPVQAQADTVRVILTDATDHAVGLSGLAWEGRHTARSQRV